MNYLLRHRTAFLMTMGLIAVAVAVSTFMFHAMVAEGQTSPPADQPPTHKAQVNFGYTLSDARVAELLDKHDAKIVGAYMTNEGFYGVHRAATSTAPAAFITSARAETASGFSNGAGDGTTTRARDFIGKHTAQNIAQDTELQTRARSMVDLHTRLDKARANAKGTAPLIYAVVVTGSESQLTALGGERVVVDFEMSAIDSDVSWSQPTLQGGVTGQGNAPSPMSAAELHAKLSTLAQRDLATGSGP